MKRFKTEIETEGPAVVMNDINQGSLGRLFDKLGLVGRVVLCRKDGKPIAESDLIYIQALIDVKLME